MPQVTFYLRVEDLDKWKGLKNKAEFIHNALHNIETPKPIVDKVEVVKAMVPGMLTANDLSKKIKERGTCRKCKAILDIRGNCLNKNC
jgi:hypothetical protein